MKADKLMRQRLFMEACLAHGIPQPIPEHRFSPPRLWKHDYFWPLPTGGIALEIQGGLWTGGRHVRGAALLKEHEKLNASATAGNHILYCQPKDVDTGAAFALVKKCLDAHKERSCPQL